MNEHDIDYLHASLRVLALTHNYNKWIIDLIKPYIKGNILEVGCGLGNLTAYLHNYGKLTCIDISKIFVKHMQIDYPEVEFRLHDISDKNILTPNNKYDTIVCVNVLEHIKEDKNALKNMHELLNSEGHLLLYVPASDKIYGSLDMTMGHCRRYNKKMLKEKLESVDFKIEKISYNNFLGFFGWFLNSKILRRKDFSILQPLIFDRFVPILAKIEQLLELPTGMSLLVIAKKA